MELYEDFLYIVKVNAKELLLISKALGGRIRTGEEVEAAKDLDLKIARARISVIKQKYDEVCKLEKNITISDEDGEK